MPIEPELLAYLRRVAAHGVEVRHEGEISRVRAKPHQSAAQHQDKVDLLLALRSANLGAVSRDPAKSDAMQLLERSRSNSAGDL